APLATNADALDETEDREQHGAPDSDLLVSRNQRHGEGRQPHQQKRGYQRGLAANAIAVMSENRRANWPRHEANGIDGEGFKRADPWVGVRKEELCKDQSRDGAVEKEIVPLDGGADRRCDDCPAKL